MIVSFETYIPTISAFASVVLPADPACATSPFAIPDIAAGDLTRVTINARVDTFAMECIRFYRMGVALNPWGFDGITETEGILFFNELDLQAQTLYAVADFASASAGQQAAIVASFQAQTVTPINPQVGGSAGAFFLFVTANHITQLVYSTNFGEHRLRNSLAGTGLGAPVYSDPADEIANPNNRPPTFGGTATGVTAWDYRSNPWPIRDTVVTALTSAFLDWQSGAASEAAYSALASQSLSPGAGPTTLLGQGS